MTVSVTERNAMLDARYGAGTPASRFFALFVGDPDAGGTEVSASGTGYARVTVTNNSTNFPAAASGVKSNGVAINFPTPTGAGWGTPTYVAEMSASSGGTVVSKSAISPARLIAAGDPVSIPIGSFVINLNNA